MPPPAERSAEAQGGRCLTKPSSTAGGFRDVLGHFATGVTVITINNDGDLRGMTANAVSSLSLDPPLLLVCVQKDASIYEHFDRAQVFAMNVLGSDQEEISNLFASHGGPEEPLGGAAVSRRPPRLADPRGHRRRALSAASPGAMTAATTRS